MFALTCTPFDWSSDVSDWLLQNVGTWVEKSVVGVAFESLGGYRSFVVNVPSTLSPVDEIDLT